MGSRRSLTAYAPSAYSKLCGVSALSTRPPRVRAIVLMWRVCSSSPSVHLRNAACPLPHGCVLGSQGLGCHTQLGAEYSHEPLHHACSMAATFHCTAAHTHAHRLRPDSSGQQSTAAQLVAGHALDIVVQRAALWPPQVAGRAERAHVHAQRSKVLVPASRVSGYARQFMYGGREWRAAVLTRSVSCDRVRRRHTSAAPAATHAIQG